MNIAVTNRRDFLRSAILLAASSPFTPLFALPNTPPATLVRKEVSSLQPTDPILVAYKAAVKRMKELPASDPRSWDIQAKIHADFCPHQNWWFLPWHRAYLYRFEQICRELSGYSQFALPYWNWSTATSVPAHFAGAANPLLNTTRARRDKEADKEFIGEDVIKKIIQLNDFQLFASGKSATQLGGAETGELEGRPHNYTHRYVGGDMAGMMSPKDPIFWCHHANVDRIWTQWIDAGHQNSKDVNWLSQEFVEFGGTPGKFKVQNLLSTFDLGYRYDTQNQELASSTIGSDFKLLNQSFVFTAVNSTVATINAPSSVMLDVSGDFLGMARDAALKNKTNSAALRSEVNVYIEDIKLPISEDVGVRVFINCDYLSKDTPIDDPHYVGTFTFFGAKHERSEGTHSSHDTNPLNFRLRLTDTLSNLLRDNILPLEDIKVQLLAMPLFGRESAQVLSTKFRIELTEK